MLKLLIVTNNVMSYRVKIWDLIGKEFDVTVAFTEAKFKDKEYPFKTIYTPGKWRGPFFIHDKPLYPLAKQFDAVISFYEIRCLSAMKLAFYPRRKYSLTFWGIGVSASYDNKYDTQSKWDKVRFFVGNKAESLVFYSDYPVEKHVKAGFDRKKLFVAPNTTEVSPNLNPNSKRDAFLFVGTLYRQKGFDILLNAYNSIREIPKKDIPVLHIIGEGPERAYLEQWIKDNGMEDKVFLHGAIYDVEKLRTFYEQSLACISPNQAGLSVLTSMGYATPFVSEKDAITGGEIFNIKNMENGILYEGGADVLKEKLVWMINNKEEVIEMGRKAKEHYDKNRTPQQMANGLMDAVRYALKVKNGK